MIKTKHFNLDLMIALKFKEQKSEKEKIFIYYNNHIWKEQKL
jgi:hypothetical protein